MAKTYNTFTNVSTGDVLTATNFNNVLTNVGNYRVPPLCLLRKNSGQALTDATDTALTWSSSEELYDTDSMHDTSTNTTRITPTTAGLYLFTAQDAVTATPTVYHILSIRLNGTTYIAYQRAGAIDFVQTSAVAYMNGTTDYVEMLVAISGTGRTIAHTSSVATTFSAAWLGQVS